MQVAGVMVNRQELAYAIQLQNLYQKKISTIHEQHWWIFARKTTKLLNTKTYNNFLERKIKTATRANQTETCTVEYTVRRKSVEKNNENESLRWIAHRKLEYFEWATSWMWTILDVCFLTGVRPRCDCARTIDAAGERARESLYVVCEMMNKLLFNKIDFKQRTLHRIVCIQPRTHHLIGMCCDVIEGFVLQSSSSNSLNANKQYEK